MISISLRFTALLCSEPPRPAIRASACRHERCSMKVVADICVIPIGVGVSVSSHIAACQKVFEDAQLSYELHSYGTNVEGDWDAVMAALKRCHEEVHKMGAPRISTQVKIGTRTDRDQSMADKVASVQKKL